MPGRRSDDPPYMLDGSEVGDLRKSATRPPVYRLAVGGRDVRLTLEQLLSWARFEKAVIEEIDRPPEIFIPHGVKAQEAWRSIVNPLFEALTVVEAPDDANPEGLLVEAVQRWLTMLPCDDEPSAVLGGSSWRDDAGGLWFRAEYLYQHLEARPMLKGLSTQQIWDELREKAGFVGKHKRFGPGAKPVWAWMAPQGFAEPETTEDAHRNGATPPPIYAREGA